MNDRAENVVERAAAFARAAHEGVGQRRKYSGEPYIVHPAAVVALVRTVTDDPATLAAAWLHDVVEDTSATIADIETAFGPDVARLVADLTDVSVKTDGNRRRRKEINRLHTAAADPRAKTVKLADLLDNLADIARADPEFARVVVVEYEALLDVLREGDPLLYAKAEVLVRETRGSLDPGAVPP